MALEEYKKKRSFDKTPEPPAVVPAQRSGDSFCVQRHHATRLHYDFRLEVNGTLKSWAVPKGPTLDPTAKHLAMMVEDHPLDYGGFEGNIPKGNYGAGSVMLWDRGTYDLLGDVSAEAQLARGDFKFRLHGEKLQGEFAIVLMKGRGKGNEWLLLKKKDAAAQPGWNTEEHGLSVLTGRTQEEIARDMPSVVKPKEKQKRAPKLKMPAGAEKAAMPKAVSPMLAEIGAEPPKGDDWWFEVKWDGVRAICFIDNGSVRLTSRNQNVMEQQYPELSVLGHSIEAGQAILDGEIVSLDAKGRPSFSLLQKRITVAEAASIAALARKQPVVFYAFDLLYLDGYDLRRCALSDRKELLEKIVHPQDPLRYSNHFPGKGAELLALAAESGLEGILAKKAASCYEGKRSSDWLKIKLALERDFVICGYAEGERAYFSSLVLGAYENGELVYVGNVGTGFDQKKIKEIFDTIHPLVTKQRPFAKQPAMLRKAVWVKPDVVCEVRFNSWTPDRHLRGPVFVSMRPDQDPRQSVLDAEPPANAENEESVAPEAALSPKKTRSKKPQASEVLTTQLFTPGAKEATLEIDGHSLKFTNLQKIFFPREGYTKGDVLEFYNGVAPLLVPHLRDRPISLKRYPNGIEGQFFFQKDAAQSFPTWLRTVPLQSEPKGKKIRYVVGDDTATLLYLTNLGCIDQNAAMSRVDTIENPDFILFDLDPVECSYDRIVEAALLVREKLDAVGLVGYPKTTGGDGMHIYVPLVPEYTFEQARGFAEVIATMLASEQSALFTTPRSVARREKNRVYFDYLQIAGFKTISTPYVMRPHAGAPVSTPLEWSEVKVGLTPADFNITNALARFYKKGDLFAGVLDKPQRLETALERLRKLAGR